MSRAGWTWIDVLVGLRATRVVVLYVPQNNRIWSAWGKRDRGKHESFSSNMYVATHLPREAMGVHYHCPDPFFAGDGFDESRTIGPEHMR
jgi:hypothetical protein